jgi:AcrR family transcriptional regulator
MRADARRNRDVVLRSARDVFAERGPDAPLDEIARRAGIGIATLYRHFPDRARLMYAVVLAALTATAEAGEQVKRENSDPLDALATYIHAVLDLRTPAVISTLLGSIDLEEPQILAARDRSSGLAQQLIDAAHDAGALRKDVTFGDIGLMLVRLSRPLPGAIPPATQDALAHRHADLFLAGLRAEPSRASLDGPALELIELQRISDDSEQPSWR